MEIHLHTHISKHDCETCGGTWNNMYDLTGDLGEIESGDYAYCYGSEDGNMDVIVDFILDALEKKGYTFERLTQSKVEEFGQTVDWKSFNDGVDQEIYDWDEKMPDDVRKYYELDEKCSEFYGIGWLSVLKECGVNITMEHTEDEDEVWDYEEDRWYDGDEEDEADDES